MSGNEIDNPEIAKWDPAFTKRVINVMTPVVKRWFRAEVRGLESFPSAGGVSVVSNHSGGILPPDWNILAPAFYGRFGYYRPLYTLAHYGVFFTPLAGSLGLRSAISRARLSGWRVEYGMPFTRPHEDANAAKVEWYRQFCDGRSVADHERVWSGGLFPSRASIGYAPHNDEHDGRHSGLCRAGTVDGRRHRRPRRSVRPRSHRLSPADW